MSQENVEIVRLMNAAFNRGDLDTAFGFYEPTAIWHSRPDEPDTGDYHGLAAIREMARMWQGMFEDFQFELEGYVEARDCVVTSGWLCGAGPRERRGGTRALRLGLSGCATASFLKSGSTATEPKPSKLWGCRSSRRPAVFASVATAVGVAEGWEDEVVMYDRFAAAASNCASRSSTATAPLGRRSPAYRRVPTTTRYSCSKRARSGVPRFHSSQKALRAASSSPSRPSFSAFARATIVGPYLDLKCSP